MNEHELILFGKECALCGKELLDWINLKQLRKKFGAEKERLAK